MAQPMTLFDKSSTSLYPTFVSLCRAGEHPLTSCNVNLNVLPLCPGSRSTNLAGGAFGRTASLTHPNPCLRASAVIGADLAEFLADGLLSSFLMRSRVLYRNDRRAIAQFCLDFDLAALRRELHRVGQEVNENLFNFALVAGEVAEPIVNDAIQFDTMPARPFAHKQQRIFDRIGQVEGRHLQVHAPGFDLDRSKMSLSESRWRPEERISSTYSFCFVVELTNNFQSTSRSR